MRSFLLSCLFDFNILCTLPFKTSSHFCILKFVLFNNISSFFSYFRKKIFYLKCKIHLGIFFPKKFQLFSATGKQMDILNISKIHIFKTLFYSL